MVKKSFIVKSKDEPIRKDLAWDELTVREKRYVRANYPAQARPGVRFTFSFSSLDLPGTAGYRDDWAVKGVEFDYRDMPEGIFSSMPNAENMPDPDTASVDEWDAFLRITVASFPQGDSDLTHKTIKQNIRWAVQGIPNAEEAWGVIDKVFLEAQEALEVEDQDRKDQAMSQGQSAAFTEDGVHYIYIADKPGEDATVEKIKVSATGYPLTREDHDKVKQFGESFDEAITTMGGGEAEAKARGAQLGPGETLAYDYETKQWMKSFYNVETNEIETWEQGSAEDDARKAAREAEGVKAQERAEAEGWIDTVRGIESRAKASPGEFLQAYNPISGEDQIYVWEESTQSLVSWAYGDEESEEDYYTRMVPEEDRKMILTDADYTPPSNFERYVVSRMNLGGLPKEVRDTAISIAKAKGERDWFDAQATMNIPPEEYTDYHQKFLEGKMEWSFVPDNNFSPVISKAWETNLQEGREGQLGGITPMIQTVSKYQQLFDEDARRQEIIRDITNTDRLQSIPGFEDMVTIPGDVYDIPGLVPPELLKPLTYDPMKAYEDARKRLASQGILYPTMEQIFQDAEQNALNYLRNVNPELRQEMMEMLPPPARPYDYGAITPEGRQALAEQPGGAFYTELRRQQASLPTGGTDASQIFREYTGGLFDIEEIDQLSPWFNSIYSKYVGTKDAGSFKNYLSGLGRPFFEKLLTPKEQAAQRGITQPRTRFI